MNNNNKLYSTVAEAAEMMGVSCSYIRELLNRAKTDSMIKLKGKKVGKEWRIDTKSINDQLGINITDTDFEKDLYIQKLEEKIKIYEIKLDSIKALIGSASNMLNL